MNYILTIIIVLLIVIVEAWAGIKLDFSSWQLKKKKQAKNSKQDKLDLDRLKYRAFNLNLQLFILIILYIGLFYVLLNFKQLQVLDAWLIVIASFVLTNLMAKVAALRRLVSTWFMKIEPGLHQFFSKIYKIGRYLNLSSLQNSSHLPVRDNVESLDELTFLIDNSPMVISDFQKRLIGSSLKFFDHQVKDIMIDFDEVFSIEPNDLLSPIRIDELSKTGHSHFPVVTSQDHVAGMLDLHRLSSLEIKETLTAKELMSKEVLKVAPTESLEEVLQLLIKEKKFLAIVESKGKAVGLISLKDIIKQVFGY